MFFPPRPNEHPNERFFDRFSLVHAAVGAVFQLSAVSAPVALGAQVAFELVENDLKRAFNPVFPDDTPDGWQNHVGDVASFMGGYYLAQATRVDPLGRVGLAALGAVAAVVWINNLTGQPQRAK